MMSCFFLYLFDDDRLAICLFQRKDLFSARTWLSIVPSVACTEYSGIGCTRIALDVRVRTAMRPQPISRAAALHARLRA